MTFHRWVVDIDRQPPRFFPADLDTRNFIEVSKLGDEWAKFLDPLTDTTHDCAEYRRQALAQKGLA